MPIKVAVHRNIALPSGCPLIISSNRPRGTAIQRGQSSGLSNLQASSRSKPKGGRDGVTAIIGRIVTTEPNMNMMIGVPVVRRGERSCAMVERPRSIRDFPNVDERRFGNEGG